MNIITLFISKSKQYEVKFKLIANILLGCHEQNLLQVVEDLICHLFFLQELDILDTLMGNYLDDGRVCACAHVAAVFGHYNQDLAIIQVIFLWVLVAMYFLHLNIYW